MPLLVGVKRGRVRDADDRPLDRQQARNRLSPRLLASAVQELEALAPELLRRVRDRSGVLDLELDAHLRQRPVRGPFLGTEARLGGLRQRPHAEVLTTAHPLTVEVVTAGARLQGKA